MHTMLLLCIFYAFLFCFNVVFMQYFAFFTFRNGVLLILYITLFMKVCKALKEKDNLIHNKKHKRKTTLLSEFIFVSKFKYKSEIIIRAL